MKDPNSLQLRNVHVAKNNHATICGEFNAKNTFGRYVGFKPFIINTAKRNELTVIDDDTLEDTKLNYAIECGTEDQREQAVITRKGEGEEAKSVSAPAPAPTTTAVLFDQPALPMVAQNTACHMGECTWAQFTAVIDVAKQGKEVLRKVVWRETYTDTPDYRQDYPTKLPPGKHDWVTRTGYYRCSLNRPAVIDWDPDKKDWLVESLNVVNPPGFEAEAVASYKLTCHGIEPGNPLEEHPEQLGYVDPYTADATHIKQLAEVLKQ